MSEPRSLALIADNRDLAVSHGGRVYIVKISPAGVPRQVARLLNPTRRSRPTKEVLWRRVGANQPKDATIRQIVKTACERWRREMGR
jgi:hypothetical protein